MVKTMTLWILSPLFFFLAIPQFNPLLEKLKAHLFQQRILESNKLIIAHLRLLKESLESGLVPTTEEWKKTTELPKPWGPLFSSALQELRNQGAPILPSLERMIQGMEEENALMLEAKMRSAQAFSQVLLSVLMIPFFAVILRYLLPEIAEKQGVFYTLFCVSMLMGMFAFYWMLQMMEDARYGNIARKRRSWILSSKLFFEQLIAEISGGHPPDVAWSKAMLSMHLRESELLQSWGVQIWETHQSKRSKRKNEVEEAIVQFGTEIRRSIQQSLIEGMGSLDRLESIHRSFQVDLKMKISRELQVLPNHCLKPLFILVFPSVLLLLFGSLGITVMKILG